MVRASTHPTAAVTRQCQRIGKVASPRIWASWPQNTRDTLAARPPPRSTVHRLIRCRQLGLVTTPDRRLIARPLADVSPNQPLKTRSHSLPAKGQKVVWLRKGNHMQCPVDGEVLVIAERSGVEIDYCPKCRGVWLDRGELDKIIGAAAQAAPQPPQAPQGGYDRGYQDSRPHKKKRESFLSDLFDF